MKLSCRQMERFLIDFEEGDLAPEVAEEFSRHLHACFDCHTFYEGYRETREISRRTFCEPGGMAASIPEEMVRAILAALELQRRLEEESRNPESEKSDEKGPADEEDPTDADGPDPEDDGPETCGGGAGSPRKQ